MTQVEIAEIHSQSGMMRQLGRRLLASRPSAREILIGSPLWGAAMAASAHVALYLRNGAETSHFYSILLLFLLGGLVAWPFALVLGRFCAQGRACETRFASFFLCLTVCTIAATAFLFALDYRSFYARWHAPVGTLTWFYQFGFTSAGAVYQFVVMGIRLYLPVGFPALAAVSLWLACKMPYQQR